MLASKLDFDTACGFDLDRAIDAGLCSPLHPLLKDHQRDIIRWAVTGGRRGIYASFGIGKSGIQLAVSKAVSEFTQRPSLIVCPLGVRQEFRRDGEMFGMSTVCTGPMPCTTPGQWRTP